MSVQPLFSFGIIADVQYADATPEFNCYYQNSVEKLQEALHYFRRLHLPFILDLGDLIDRDFGSFDPVLKLYQQAGIPVHFALGNHDFNIPEEKKKEVSQLKGIPPEGYYNFTFQNVRFIMLNGCEVSLFAPSQGSTAAQEAAMILARLQQQNSINAREWNGAISKKQQTWLQAKLKEAQQHNQQVIVAGHYPIYPQHMHNLWNDEEIVAKLEQFPNVMAYFNGHNHRGNYAQKNGIYFLNFKGMVETEENAFAVVHVFADRLEIEGHGREESRVLEV